MFDRGCLSGPESGRSQVVVLLLLGEKQSGKSSAGNIILGRAAFHKKTSRSCREDGAVFGTQVNNHVYSFTHFNFKPLSSLTLTFNVMDQVSVVDTPGWMSRSTTPDRVSREVCRALTLCQPEPHAILLVLPATSTFGQEEWKAMEAQLRLLQTPVWQRAMVLFTHGDKLGKLIIY